MINLRVVVLTLCSLTYDFAANVAITANPKQVEAGQKTTITWRVEKAKFVYMSGLGLVPAQGSRELTFLRSTDVNIVATVDGKVLSGTTKVVVSGAKGSSDFPSDLDQFRFPLSGSRKDIAIEDFLAQVHRILQDQLGFSVSETKDEDQPYCFITNLSERRGLVQPSENGIRARKIAFIVRVRPDGDSGEAVWYEVATLLEYQRRAESTWRPDGDENRHQVQASSLKRMLDSVR